MRRNRSGFSLMELIAVVTIIGVIAALVIPRINFSNSRAQETCCFHNRSEINFAVERWMLEKGEWPTDDLEDIGEDTDYFPDGLPTCPVSGRAYRLNPHTHRVTGHDGGVGGKGGSSHSL